MATADIGERAHHGAMTQVAVDDHRVPLARVLGVMDS
jgi:hypothetical protein